MVSVSQLRGDKRANLQIWDIGGQSIGSKMLDKYIFGSDIVFLCYDVTDPQSFQDLEDWLKMVQSTIAKREGKKESSMATPEIYICGNKIDLAHLRRINEEAHDNFVKRNKLYGGFFLSAQSGDNVKTIFYDAAARSLGIKLSAYELEFTKKILAVTVNRSTDDNVPKSAVEQAIEAEDLSHGSWQDMVDRASEEDSKKKKKCCIL